MELRELTAADAGAIERLHAAMGLGYALPDPRSSFFVKVGIFEETQLVTAVLGRMTSEAYLLCDRKWGTPEGRWKAIQLAMVCAAQQAKLSGIDDTHVWLPPSIEKRFSKRLAEFAFVKAPWNCYTAKL